MNNQVLTRVNIQLATLEIRHDSYKFYKRCVMAIPKIVNADLIGEIARKLPKVELHCHIDGSLSPQFIFNAAKKRNVKLPDFLFKNHNLNEAKEKEKPSNSTQQHAQQIPNEPYDHPFRKWIMIQKLKTMHQQEQSRYGQEYLEHKLSDYIDSSKNTSNWGVFDFMNQFLQSKEELYDATYDIVNYLYYNHNTQLIELRFCPSLHCLENLDEETVIDNVLKGFNQAKIDIYEKSNIIICGGIILCGLRSMDSKHSLYTAKLCQKYISPKNSKNKNDKNRNDINTNSNKNKNQNKKEKESEMKDDDQESKETDLDFDINVIGFDIAGKEDDVALQVHEESILYCKKHNIPVTVHAGEWPITEEQKKDPKLHNTSKNIRLAVLEYKVNRLGHAITLGHDKELVQLLNEINKKNKKNGEECDMIGIECCLTSNCGSKTKVRSFEEHPIFDVFLNSKNDFYRVSLSSDNLLLSGNINLQPNSTNEIIRFMTKCNGTWKQVKRMLLDGVEMSFDSQARSDRFRKQFEKQIDDVFQKYKIQG